MSNSSERGPSAQTVGLGGAIANFFRYYAVFSGRASRSEFWLAALFLFLTAMPVVFSTFIDSVEAQLSSIILLWVWMLATLLPTLALYSRRLRDAGFHPALLLLILVPFGGIAVLIMCAMESKGGEARRAGGATGPHQEVTKLSAQLSELEDLHAKGLIDAKQLKEAKDKALGI